MPQATGRFALLRRQRWAIMDAQDQEVIRYMRIETGEMAPPAPLKLLRIHVDGALLVEDEDTLWFTPEFAARYSFIKLACTESTSIELSMEEYIQELETLTGAELDSLIDTIYALLVESLDDGHAEADGMPSRTQPADRGWIEEYILIQNATSVSYIKNLINPTRHYSIQLVEEVLETY